MKTADGSAVGHILLRTDIGCSDSQLHDKDTNWDPKKRTFFLNEIEPSSTTYFIRWLKFDSIPMWGKLYAQKAREIYKAQMKKATGKKTAKSSTKKVVAKSKTVMKVKKMLKK